jgi:hypothetical protein
MLSSRKRRLASEVAIVLGGGIHRDGTPGETTILRAQTAAQLAKTHPNMTIILSGDGRGDADPSAKSEAWQMAQILKQRGVVGRRLWLESESRETIGNAVLVYARYLHRRKPRKIYLITSPFHAERAKLSFSGLLGPKWEIEVVTCEEAPGDALRWATEPGGIEWMKRFFEGVEPGDLPAVVEKLQRMGKPYFRQLAWLNRFSKRTA